MAAILTAGEAVQVLWEIDRLWQQLTKEPQPGAEARRRPTVAYLALVEQIRERADRFRAWEDLHPPEKLRMVKAGLKPWTTPKEDEHDDDEDEDLHPRR